MLTFFVFALDTYLQVCQVAKPLSRPQGHILLQEIVEEVHALDLLLKVCTSIYI